MSLQQQGTAACKMRDDLIEARYAKKITLAQITDRLYKQDLPDWLQSQIIQMVRHRYTERITCAVELAMEKAVNMKIIDQIKAEEKAERGY